MKDGESLEYDYAPEDSLRVQVERAVAACPVQAISICRLDEQLGQQGGNQNEKQ
jgi:hypothetical protein